MRIRNMSDGRCPEDEIDGVRLDRPDFRIIDGGSIQLLEPLTDTAREWVDENIGADNGYQPYYPTVVVERRYLPPVLEGILGDGLSLGT